MSLLLSLLLVIFAWTLPFTVHGHGRLIEPPSRSSMWRYGFNTTANYNDHELYCGGFARQHRTNGGKCGVCGDPYDGPKPNEAGGPYAQGIIVRKYRRNSIVRIKVELTANHKGYFEFRLCPNNNVKKVVSQKCLDSHLLQQSNGEGSRYYPGEGTKVFESRYLLPKGMTCTQCVLQWTYTAANSWGGPCEDGRREGIGCGPQETFRACSDVAIYDDRGYASDEEPESDDNDVGIDTLTGTDNDLSSSSRPTSKDSTNDTMFWPFLMALLALTFATLAFGVLFWWFYRKQLMEYIRDATDRFRKKSPSNFDNGSMYTSQRSGVPIPPPRSKKHQQGLTSPADYYGTRRQITPDVISEPLQVTINGLPV